MPSGLQRELRKEADLLARERSCGRKPYDNRKRAASQSDSRGLLTYNSEFSKNDRRTLLPDAGNSARNTCG